jgi:hypothetical protein
MPTLKTLTFAVFMLSTVAFAQQATVKVTDVSDKGSPVVVTGSATFEANDDGKTLETVESYEATGMNVSGRNLLAVVVESRGFDFRGPASNYYSVEDYYFKPGIIRAGEAMVVSEAERAPFSQKSPQESKPLLQEWKPESCLLSLKTGQRGAMKSPGRNCSRRGPKSSNISSKLTPLKMTQPFKAWWKSIIRNYRG